MRGKGTKWWWLSFANPDGFLGVIVGNGDNPWDIKDRAWEMGINPGGEIAACQLESDEVPDEKFRWRLLSRQELIDSGLGVPLSGDDALMSH
jgi:hypothetical protein